LVNKSISPSSFLSAIWLDWMQLEHSRELMKFYLRWHETPWGMGRQDTKDQLTQAMLNR
jgi:hypothetical protein